MELKITLSLSIFLVVLSCFSFNVAEELPTEAPTTTTTTTTAPTTTPVTTTTQTPEEVCKSYNKKSCEDCIKGHAQCYYCEENQQCSYFNTLIPGYENCGSLSKVKWSTCKINFQAMIIGVSVVGGVLLLGLIICCCCCCRKRKNLGWLRDQAKWERQREDLKMKSDERRMERQTRTDDIRRKYGLMKTGSNYQRFDA